MRKFKDYSGQTFGKLIVVKRVYVENNTKDTIWECNCLCGNSVNVYGSNLKRTFSCGCLSKDKRIHTDIIGIRKGKLVVIEEMDSIKTKTGSYRMVLCKCDCGNILTKRLTSIFYESDRSGSSCGCLKSEKRDERERNKPDFGIRKHPLYIIWKGIRDRCYRKNNKRFDRYGGRGIKMSDDWYNSFNCFYYWAILNGYKKGLSIDRIDNDKGYFDYNCRFATPLEQANNKSGTIYVNLYGNKISLADACRKLGIRYGLVRQRMYRDGKSFEDSIK